MDGGVDGRGLLDNGKGELCDGWAGDGWVDRPVNE